MQIPLNQFEQIIDETILKRGLQYFKKGNVHDPIEIGLGMYEFIVEGSENYTVQLTIKNQIVTEYVCDCPYDYGPVCKHVAAAIFYLQQNELGLSETVKKAKNTQTDKPAKRKTITDQVNELLDRVSHDELKRFVRENASQDKHFRNLFLSSFAHYNYDDSKGFYEKQIKLLLRAAKDRYGFIDYSSARLVGIVIDNLLESAQKQIDNRNYKSAFFICTAVMEQMTEALQFSDDSNGDVGGCIEAAYEMLYTIAREPISEEIRKLIIDYCFTAYEKEIFSGWHWHIGVLRLASLLLETEDEIERILEYLDKTHASDYHLDEAQNIKYEILLEKKGVDVAEKYMEQNITNPILRREAIQKALIKKDFAKAIYLAQNGVNYDMKDRPGLAMEWYDWLLKIALAQNDTEKIIEYARLLFIDNFTHEQDYYQILKHHVAPEKWSAFVESMLQEISSNREWVNTGLMARIFIKEEYWDRLLDLVKKSPDFMTLENYEKYLSGDYANELVNLYADAILKYMRNNMGREHYQSACRYIRKIIKLGGKDKADEIIATLRNEYPKRKALMEELDKI